MQTKTDLKIDWATHESATYACKTWHYSRCMPAGKLVKVGVWESGKFIGVVLFGLGATPNLSKSYDLKMTECCELTRVALTKHATPVSRVVAIALRFLKKQCPGVRLVVSFADASQGHHGGIYQAGGWLFSGSVELDHWVINGKKMHPRSVVMRYGSQSRAHVLTIDPKAEKVWGIKHRYLMPLDAEMRQRIEPLRKSYPKRAANIANDATGSQPVEGGATPTAALQISGAANG